MWVDGKGLLAYKSFSNFLSTLSRRFMDYSKFLANRTQLSPLIGRDDMVKNSAGGYVFETPDENLLERFLLLGTENGSYYSSEEKLTEDNTKQIVRMIKGNGYKVVVRTVEFLLNGRAPKVDAAIFTLALCATYGDALIKKYVYDNVKNVCRTSTHLFMFVSNVNNLRGWSRGLRKAVASWYLDKSLDDLGHQVVKYRNREGFTHKDVLRLCHPKTKDENRNLLFKYIVGKLDGMEVPVDIVKVFTKAQLLKGDELVALIKSSVRISWEMVSTEELNNPKVLMALLDRMPYVALMRNLNRFANVGLTNETSNDVSKTISMKLRNKESIHLSKIHPLTIINYATTYSSGKGFKGKSSWTPNQEIVDSMYEAYEIALQNVTVPEVPILVGVDVSGSMAHNVSNMNLNASQIGNILALTMLKTSPSVDVVGFDTRIKPVNYGRRTSVDTVVNTSPIGGGTDCSLPITYALTTKKYYDTIVIFTDSETWAGRRHGIEVLNEYRKTINKDVKIVEVLLVSNTYTSYPKDTPNVLRVVGFDSHVIDIINKYTLGSLV
jgi:60 kDa SS-A/Ro ribonucleoprotein